MTTRRHSRGRRRKRNVQRHAPVPRYLQRMIEMNEAGDFEPGHVYHVDVWHDAHCPFPDHAADGARCSCAGEGPEVVARRAA